MGRKTQWLIVVVAKHPVLVGAILLLAELLVLVALLRAEATAALVDALRVAAAAHCGL